MSKINKIITSGTYFIVNRELQQLYGLDAAVLIGYLGNVCAYHNDTFSVYHTYQQFAEHADLKRRRLDNAIDILVKAKLLSVDLKACGKKATEGYDVKVRTFTIYPDKLQKIIYRQKQKNRSEALKRKKSKILEKHKAKEQSEQWKLLQKATETAKTEGFVIGEGDFYTKKSDLEVQLEEIYNFNVEYVKKFNDIHDYKLFSIPRQGTKRVQELYRQIKMLQNEDTFLTQNSWDSEWLDLYRLKETPICYIKDMSEFKRMLVRAVKNYAAARTDNKMLFFGKRTEAVSLSEFVYNAQTGRSLFWYWYHNEPTKKYNIEWCGEYMKGIRDDEFFFAFDSDKEVKESYIIRVCRILKWFRMKRRKGLLDCNTMGIIDKRVHIIKVLTDWYRENGSFGLLPFPSTDNQRFKSFLGYLRQSYGFSFRKGSNG